MDSNPDCDIVFFSVDFFIFFLLLSFFLSPLYSLTPLQRLLERASVCFTTHHRGSKRKESQKNPSSDIFEANTGIKSMCWKTGIKTRLRHKMGLEPDTPEWNEECEPRGPQQIAFSENLKSENWNQSCINIERADWKALTLSLSLTQTQTTHTHTLPHPHPHSLSLSHTFVRFPFACTHTPTYSLSLVNFLQQIYSDLLSRAHLRVCEHCRSPMSVLLKLEAFSAQSQI